MANDHALGVRRFFPRLTDQLKNCFGYRGASDSRTSILAIKERYVIKRTLKDSTAPTDVNAMHLQGSCACRCSKLKQEAPKSFHIPRILTSGLSVCSIVMPTVDIDDEKN